MSAVVPLVLTQEQLLEIKMLEMSKLLTLIKAAAVSAYNKRHPNGPLVATDARVATLTQSVATVNLIFFNEQESRLQTINDEIVVLRAKDIAQYKKEMSELVPF